MSENIQRADDVASGHGEATPQAAPSDEAAAALLNDMNSGPAGPAPHDGAPAASAPEPGSLAAEAKAAEGSDETPDAGVVREASNLVAEVPNDPDGSGSASGGAGGGGGDGW